MPCRDGSGWSRNNDQHELTDEMKGKWIGRWGVIVRSEMALLKREKGERYQGQHYDNGDTMSMLKCRKWERLIDDAKAREVMDRGGCQNISFWLMMKLLIITIGSQGAKTSVYCGAGESVPASRRRDSADWWDWRLSSTPLRGWVIGT